VIERIVSFETAAHSADAIQRAAYRHSDRLSLAMRDAGGSFECVLSVIAETEAEADSVVHDFRNEVLDQVLRGRIREETAGVRNVILALAFRDTALVEAD
jgi:His-Xaa-Ser system protein HxsD